MASAAGLVNVGMSDHDLHPGSAVILLMLTLLSTPSASLEADGWSESFRRAGVTAYVRPHGDGELKASLAVGTIDAPPWVVKNALDDYDVRDGAMPYLAEMKVLRRDERGTLIYHRASPPLISQRDYTILMFDDSERRADGSIVYVTGWQAANDDGPPPRPGVVRVQRTEGEWRLEPIDGGRRTRASYYVFADPGGDLPKGMVQLGATNMLVDIFKAIRSRAKDPKYQQALPPVTETFADVRDPRTQPGRGQ